MNELPNYADRLDAALSETQQAVLKTIAAEARDQGKALYVVGGFVRDLIMGHPGLDLDLVVEGDAIALARALAKRHGGRVTTHRRFGTAKWHLLKVDGIDPEGVDPVDLVTARTEFYAHPTALPTVEQGSIQLDLHRRDFTINTLALRLDAPHYGDLHDYWGGLDDLRRGLIRVLHSRSFIDDPTRMLRAVRFEARFGFEIEPRTLELLPAAIGLLARVSGDRIRHEIDYILDEPEGPRMLDRLQALGLLAAIDPDLFWDPAAHAAAFSGETPDAAWGLGGEIAGVPLRRALAYLFWLFPLQADRSSRIAHRLRLRQSLAGIIADAARLREDLPQLAGEAPARITFRLDRSALPAVYAVWRTTKDDSLAEPLLRYAQTWRHIKPVTDGHTLEQRGLPPGPVYGQILAALREAWLNGEISSEAEELETLERLLHTEPQG